MILLINICKEKLHYYEFVKPISDILELERIKYMVKSYEEIDKKLLKNVDKIIICGTSLKDNEFLKKMDKFEWIKTFNEPILGVCGGMQVIGLLYKGKLKKKTEIGFYSENFKEFFGLKGKEEVYHLHNNWVKFTKDFIIYNKGEIHQAVKHKNKSIYGVLFHPEVRNKDMILEFVNNC